MIYQPIIQTRISILIANEIRSSIMGSNLSTGDKLPPVEEIAKKLGVSGPSVRKAITILSAAGIVDTLKSRGTVVTTVRDIHGDQILAEMAGILQK